VEDVEREKREIFFFWGWFHHLKTKKKRNQKNEKKSFFLLSSFSFSLSISHTSFKIQNRLRSLPNTRVIVQFNKISTLFLVLTCFVM